MNRTRNNEARERERCTPWNGQVNPLISDTRANLSTNETSNIIAVESGILNVNSCVVYHP